MRNTVLLVTFVAVALCAAAFWADGQSIGATVVSSAILGLAVFLHSRTVDSLAVQSGIAIVYLASVAFGSVAENLINKALGEDIHAGYLLSSETIGGVIMGWAICSIFLRNRHAEATTQDQASN